MKTFKVPKTNALVMVTGGVKCGKSTFAVYLALQKYNSNLREVKFKNFFRKMFKKPLEELPKLYSNIPLSCDYVALENCYLLREKRLNYKSVVLIDEASLVANNMLFKNDIVNRQLVLFFKLFGHETKGGTCIIDTQCIQDVHYSVKRSIAEYFYIHHIVKWIPFVIVAYVLENRYSEDNSVIATDNTDIEEKLKKVVFLKSTWRKFDAFCFSKLTDYLDNKSQIVKGAKLENLKTDNIYSFDKNINIKGGKYE